MVEIIPYTEDDEDASTWIPLSAPNAHIGGSMEASVSNQEKTTIEDTHESSEWQELPSAPVTSNIQSSNSESAWSWGNQLISHLTSTPTLSMSKEDGYSSENDEDIVWGYADELKDDKLLFSKKKGGSESADKRKSTSERKILPSSAAQRRTPTSNGSKSQQNLGTIHDTTTNSQGTVRRDHQAIEHPSYRQEAKIRLQQTLIYDPMRELPFCILRNLYNEGKHELSIAWNAYSEANRPIIFAPLTFFITVGILGIVLMGTGVTKIGWVVLVAAMRFSVSFAKFMIYGAWTMSTRLAWISLIFFVALGLMVWIWMLKVRETPSSSCRSTGEHQLRWFLDISSLIPLTVALMSPSMYELIAILYSLQVLSLSSSNGIIYNWNSAQEYDTYGSLSIISYPPTALLLAVVVVVLMSFGITVFSGYLERDSKHKTESVAEVGDGEYELLDESLSRIKRHLNSCHILSVAILVLLAGTILLLRATYLYFGGDLLNILSELGTIGIQLVYIVFAALLVLWAGKSATRELTQSRVDEEGRNLYQKIARKALKESMLDITTNAVWNNACGLTGALSEEDGILRLAVLEWLIDRWTSSSGNSHSSSSTVPPSDHEHSKYSSDLSNNGTTTKSQKMEYPWSPTEKTSNSAKSSHAHASGISYVEIFNSFSSYKSLEKVITKLDADEALIPAIESYRAWVYSLPPSRNVAMMVACWKMCPGMTVLLLVTTWSTLMHLKRVCFSLISSQFLSEQCGSSIVTSSKHVVWVTTITLSPLIYVEYLRVCRWWSRVVRNINEPHKDEKATPDSLAIMLEHDYDGSSISGTRSIMNLSALNKLILHMWNLLIESIDLLESFIPVVRCATVACAAANLTNDAACLVDLAVEIKHRGLFGGIGVLLVDAFSHHLQEELCRRQLGNTNDTSADNQASTPDDDFGGKYTRSLIKSMGHTSKLMHNLNRLKKGDAKPQEYNRYETEYTLMKEEGMGATSNDQVEEDSKSSLPTVPPEDIVDNDHVEGDSNACIPTAAANDTSDRNMAFVNSSVHHSEEASITSSDDKPREMNSEENFSHQSSNSNESSKKDCYDNIAFRQTDTSDGSISCEPETDKAADEDALLRNAQDVVPISGDQAIDEVLHTKAQEGMSIWLGGGIAVVSAVVGGLAVAAASGKKQDDKEERRKS